MVTKKQNVVNLAQKMRERLNKRTGKETAKSYGEGENLLQVKSWIPLKEFFKLASGGDGFPCGHITQIIGEPDSGKTTLMMEGMVSCQKEGGVVYLIDSEHKFSLQRFALMGGVPEDINVIGSDCLEDAWESIHEICQDISDIREEGLDFPVMICWDSIAASVPNKILEDDSGDAHVAVEAKLNNKNVRKLRQFIKKANVAVVGINHYYTTMPSPGKPPKDIIKGGEELTFMSTLVVKTKKGKKLERGVLGETQQIGRVTKFQIAKGHFHGRTIVKDVFVVDKGILETKEDFDAYKKTLKGDY